MRSPPGMVVRWCWGNGRGKVRTSPSNRKILKLRLLILSCGELGKHTMQFVNE